MKKRSIFLLTICLFFAVLITAGLLVTYRKAKANESNKSTYALEEVFPDAVRYSDAIYSKFYLSEYLEQNGLDISDVIIDHIVYARDELSVVKGLIVYVKCYKKNGGIIFMTVGIQNNGTINGYSVLDISDAKGLDLQIKETSFKEQFEGKSVPKFVLSYDPDSDDEIKATSGAEDASQAVVNGVNASIYTLEFIDESMGGLLE